MISAGKGFAQFSPGELTRAHHNLEGTQQCARCHDVGREISGTKCLTCHLPIKHELETKQGYHFSVSEKKCVTCHKDHLGIDARITIVDPLQIDHKQTGFALTGKHGSIKCEQCHSAKNIKDPLVIASLSEKSRTTYLGLETKCVSCHEDRHQGKLGTSCQSCHTTTSWTSIPAFDHSKTKFVLTGKHETVSCSKCHAAITSKADNHVVNLSTKAFNDCTPCHTSPHTAKFSSRSCSSCHTTQAWNSTVSASFDHNQTAFKLIGRHAEVKCQQCHHSQPNAPSGSSLKLPHAKCMDCHADYHDGQFTKAFNNDCAKCHTEQGFRPSTFSMNDHSRTQMKLTGAHAAVPCGKCHAASEGSKAPFHFANLTCETCHKDVHRGQFNKIMGKNGCASCHSSEDWHVVRYDHSRTNFTLTGKHSVVQCKECHVSAVKGSPESMKFKGTAHECQACHKEVHVKQFEVHGATACEPCHKTTSWHTLAFDHNVQSTFHLTGAHKNVECKSCHHGELSASQKFIRYKPMYAACEACHKEMRK